MLTDFQESKVRRLLTVHVRRAVTRDRTGARDAKVPADRVTKIPRQVIFYQQ